MFFPLCLKIESPIDYCIWLLYIIYGNTVFQFQKSTHSLCSEPLEILEWKKPWFDEQVKFRKKSEKRSQIVAYCSLNYKPTGSLQFWTCSELVMFSSVVSQCCEESSTVCECRYRELLEAARDMDSFTQTVVQRYAELHQRLPLNDDDEDCGHRLRQTFIDHHPLSTHHDDTADRQELQQPDDMQGTRHHSGFWAPGDGAGRVGGRSSEVLPRRHYYCVI